MTIDEVLAHFEGVKRIRDGDYIALCRSHNDRNPSLSIKEMPDRILLHCHAGCHINAVVQAAGLTFDDLFFEDKNNGHKKHSTDLTKSKVAIPRFTAPTLRRIADIIPTTVKWLWPPYIPYGKLTLLEGDPGEGKSWVSLAVGTAQSLGNGLPGVDGLQPGNVIIMSAEDGLSDTIRPRLSTFGADISRIYAIDGLFTLDAEGCATLESYIQQLKPLLVIIDPLVAYLSGDVDIHKANQVRQVTAHLASLAERYGPAILAIRHLTKGGSLKPIYRGLGSIDFTAAARSVLLAGSDPDNPQTRGIVHLKCNLAPKGEAIGYELRDDGFFWTGQSELTYEKVFSSGDGGNALTEAKHFLMDTLLTGSVPANDVYEEAEAQDIAKRTVDRAKRELKIIVKRVGEEGKRGKGKWHWELPEDEF